MKRIVTVAWARPSYYSILSLIRHSAKSFSASLEQIETINDSTVRHGKGKNLGIEMQSVIDGNHFFLFRREMLL